jgi:hypothetical protein
MIFEQIEVENSFGWFDQTESFEELAKDERQVWLDRVQRAEPERVPSSNPENKGAYMSSIPLGRIPAEKSEQPKPVVVYQYVNPNPSFSTKLSNSSGSDMAAMTSSMNISASVNAFRLCQNRLTGEIYAEFNFIFCYGSRSYNSWKTYNDFKDFWHVIENIHTSSGGRRFQTSMTEWRVLEEKKNWFRCLNVIYLFQKSTYLSKFMQAVLLESTNPGLMLCFAQSKIPSLSFW